MVHEIVIKFYADPGHGWAAVKLATANKLGFLEKVSPYSYIKGKTIYLEEDSDLCLYCNTIRENGNTFTFSSKHTNARHPIRSYSSATQENILKSISSGE